MVSLITVLSAVLILVIIGLPVWPHSGKLGYYPGGLAAALLLVVIALLFAGVL